MNYEEIQAFIKAQKIFDIRDYLDKLTPTNRRERNKYFCPACNMHNLHVGPNGEWTCWNQTEAEHRREIIIALTGIDYRQLYRDIHYAPSEKRHESKVYLKPKPLRVIDNILFNKPIDFRNFRIARAGRHLPGIQNHPITQYWYSKHQRAVRVEQDSGKYFYYEHLAHNKWQLGSGAKYWHPYGIHQLIPANRPRPNQNSDHSYLGILILEGQKSVDLAHQRNIAAICLEAGDYHDKKISMKLTQISRLIKNLVFICFPDNDSAGMSKMLKVYDTATSLKIPCILIPPHKLIHDPQQGDDIEQFIWQCKDPPIQVLENSLLIAA
jgi:hypothetical protein